VILPLAALTAAAAFGVPSAAGADLGVEELMRSLAQVRSRTASFVERKHVAILNAPLESSGTLVYTAPGRLEKHTIAPRAESLVLEGDRLTLEDKGRDRKRTFALPEQPVIQAFVEGVRSTLAGDLATLSRFYQVALEGNERRWRLLLRPREQRMQDFVSEIRISGSLDRIRTIEIVEAGGDRSVMTITGNGA
jgi:Outer membrane lipoprotein carrier protein LolA-like